MDAAHGSGMEAKSRRVTWPHLGAIRHDPRCGGQGEDPGDTLLNAMRLRVKARRDGCDIGGFSAAAPLIGAATQRAVDARAFREQVLGTRPATWGCTPGTVGTSWRYNPGVLRRGLREKVDGARGKTTLVWHPNRRLPKGEGARAGRSTRRRGVVQTSPRGGVA